MALHKAHAAPRVAPIWGRVTWREFLPIHWARVLDVATDSGPELLGTVSWGTRVSLEPGRFVPLPRDMRGWPILALERLNRDLSERRHRTAPKLEFQ